MAQLPVSTSSELSNHAALELSKNSWLLAIQLADRDNPSLHPIKGGDDEGLIAKLDVVRQRLAKASGLRPPLQPDVRPRVAYGLISEEGNTTPPTTVPQTLILRIFSLGTTYGSCSSTAKSANLPAAMLPILSSTPSV